MSTKKRFNQNGDHSKNIARYLLTKAIEARNQGLDPSRGDFTWQTFLTANESLVAAIVRDHPGKPDDPQRICRENFGRQTKRFIAWLKTAAGYPETFLRATGLLDANLSGDDTGGVNNGGPTGNDEQQADDDSDVPLGDLNNSSSTQTSNRQSNSAFNFANVQEELEEIETTNKSKMKVKACVIERVTVRGDVGRTRNVVALSVELPPGGLAATLKINRDDEDHNKMIACCDIDANASSGDHRTKSDYDKMNLGLSNSLKEGWTKACDAQKGPGRDHEVEESSFSLPKGVHVEENPLDPYAIYLRSRPTAYEESLFDTKVIKMSGQKGTVAPILSVIAFFPVAQAGMVRTSAGFNLKFQESYSDEEEDSPRPASSAKKRRATGAPSTPAGAAAAARAAAAAAQQQQAAGGPQSATAQQQAFAKGRAAYTRAQAAAAAAQAHTQATASGADPAAAQQAADQAAAAYATQHGDSADMDTDHDSNYGTPRASPRHSAA